MDWDDLKVFLAVHRAGSLVAAARSLRLDKATVSRRVSALESSLGVRLLDRRPEGVALTPHGQRVVSAVDGIDELVASLTAELSEARGDATGVVHLTVPQFFATHVLMPALVPFCARHPGIELILNASSAVMNIAQREAEVGLRNRRPDQASVTVKRVGKLDSAIYASRDYLERRGRPATAADVAAHDLIAWDRALTFVPAFQWLNDAGAAVAFRGNDAQVLCDAAAAGLGLAVLPVLLGDERGLTRLDALGRGREEIWAVAPGELRRSARVRWVLELVAEVFAANQARLAGVS